MASSSDEKRRSWSVLIMLAVLALVGAAVAAAVYFSDSGESFSSRLNSGEESARQPSARRPATRRPPPKQYVGSAKCAECHEEIAEPYSRHTMSHSIARVPDDRGIEQVEQVTLRPGGRCVYKVKKDDQGWWHAEAAVDASGNTIYEQWFPIAFAIGSGIRGRTYLVNRDGILFRSPISWYTGGKKWDLSPGYQPDDPRRFNDRISDECLACHAGRVNDLAESKRRFGNPVIVEAAIGCERCHGAGRAHVEYQEADDPTGDDPILAVASLDTDRQNALCSQCHLVGASRVPKYGYTTWDFQPGDRLQDVFVSFVHPASTVHNPSKAVSQVEQMYASRCFEASGRKLLCTTCHDPHALLEEKEKPMWYRSRCLTCHDESSCELELADRKRRVATDACTECHMPTVSEINVAHTVQTDHRIVRRPGQSTEVPDWTARFGLAFFDHCDRELPEWEFKRSLGLALDVDLAVNYDQARDVEMEKMLASVLPRVPDDPDVLMSLGRAAMRREDRRAAENYFRQGLRYHPRHEGFLGGLAMLYGDMNREQESLELVDRLIGINPWDAGTHALRAETLRRLGRLDEAFESMQQALKLNPRLPNGREWLIEFCRQNGRIDEMRRQFDILRRLARE